MLRTGTKSTRIEARKIEADVKALARECAPEAIATLKGWAVAGPFTPARASPVVIAGEPWKAMTSVKVNRGLGRTFDPALADQPQLS